MANIFRLHFTKREHYYSDVEANTLDEAIAKESDIQLSDMKEADGTLECIFDEDHTRIYNSENGIL